MNKFLIWLPRILAVSFNAFLTIFALDVFVMQQWYLALLIHLIPNFIILFATIIAWKRELIGGLIFLIVGIFFTFFFHSFFLGMPMLIIGLFFLFSYKLNFSK